ncbi:hypothetical protein [Parachlamydia sp. AcF125]|uniref:hypothetical protein n=1 Tax=Parachlamydia sp. AcF125 TaxID=2795736 RepID=UPI001BCA068F|nr:hypothetical protein [Parachlamydia sp. AcF125]MBS4167395.1 hypothetical protein [Parachlamydia sp. AcF125]
MQPSNLERISTPPSLSPESNASSNQKVVKEGKQYSTQPPTVFTKTSKAFKSVITDKQEAKNSSNKAQNLSRPSFKFSMALKQKLKSIKDKIFQFLRKINIFKLFKRKRAFLPKQEKVRETNISTSGKIADLQLRKLVRVEVKAFLKPYLMEKITAETEDKRRGPLVHSILEKIKEKHGIHLENESSLVQKYAIEGYFDSCASDLCLKYAREFRTDVAQARQNATEVLIQALSTALKIDFPGLHIEDKEMREKATTAITQAWNKQAGASVSFTKKVSVE